VTLPSTLQRFRPWAIRLPSVLTGFFLGTHFDPTYFG